MKIIDSVLINEWDYEKNEPLGLNPSALSYKSNKKVWWKCDKGHSWMAAPSNRTARTKMSRCPLCSGKKIVQGVNDLATIKPELVRYWDFSKNSIDINHISPGSNEFAFWICEKGHSFKTRIYNMSNSIKGMNCPVCRNFEVASGINDLFTTNPELIEEWDYEKNNIDPTTIHASMQKTKYWWKCSRGHSYLASTYLRAKMGTGCPYCSNQKLMPGENDLLTLMPSIANHWDYSRNLYGPERYIGTHSNKNVFFLCDKGHSFKRQISDYVNGGDKCPYCIGKKILVGFNDLSTTNPFISNEWNYEKNGKLTPKAVTSGSEKKVWWICEKGHEWEATINSRNAGRGCPICSKERQSSLPEKAIFYYAKKYFDDAIENEKLHNFGKREFDIYIPSIKCAIEYDGVAWHSNIVNDFKKDTMCKENDITIIRFREKGCPIYSSNAIFIECDRVHSNLILLEQYIIKMFEIINSKFQMHILPNINIENDLSKINSLFISYNKNNSVLAHNRTIALEWNYEKNYPLTPEMVSFSSQKRVWWKCEKGHEWLAIVSSRTRENKNGCPICGNKKLLKGYNDLESRFPNIAIEFDIVKNNLAKPDEIVFSSHKKYWWKCAKNHSFNTMVYLRTINGVGCPICAGQRADAGINDLLTVYPGIMKLWDYERNERGPNEFLPKSEKVVWWKCKEGHSYQQAIFLKIKNLESCPYCGNRALLKGFNDLQTRYPKLANEWNYEKNSIGPDEVVGSKGSHKRFWWKCEKGHEWETALSSRIGLKTNCPYCENESRRKK